MKVIPIEVFFSSICLSDDAGEVFENDFLLPLMLGNPTIIMLQSENMVFSPSSIDAPMEVFGVGVSLPQIGNTGTLLLS